ncbi:spermidine synthase isoform X3 [Anabrus simplex]|uniref:spermidine synthase isoform X3 n=1 Tax=Anabrus simplex TaxID=316456 RepID=UPI0035A3299B
MCSTWQASVASLNLSCYHAQVMDALKEGWFSELSPLWPGMSLSLEVDKVLHSEKSTYQDILVVKTSARSARRRKNAHPYTVKQLQFGDFIDLTSLSRPAVSLFQQPYFNLMQKALRPGGIVCSQVGTVWGNIEHVVETLRCCQTSFSSAALAYAAVPTYPTGQISFVLGSLDKETVFKEPVYQFTEEQLEDMSLRYYTSDVHRSAFVLPRFAEKAIKKAGLTTNK